MIVTDEKIFDWIADEENGDMTVGEGQDGETTGMAEARDEADVVVASSRPAQEVKVSNLTSLSDDKATQTTGSIIILMILFLTAYYGIILITLVIIIFSIPLAIIIEYIILKCKGKDLIHCPWD